MPTALSLHVGQVHPAAPFCMVDLMATLLSPVESPVPHVSLEVPLREKRRRLVREGIYTICSYLIVLPNCILTELSHLILSRLLTLFCHMYFSLKV